MARSRLLALLLALAALATPLLLRAQASSPEQQTALEAVAGPLYDQLAEIRFIASPGAPPPVLVRSRADNRRFIAQEI